MFTSTAAAAAGVHVALELAVSLMISLQLVGSQCPQEPSLGDLRVRSDDNAVTVYYTDGIEMPQWIPICTENAGSNVYSVICRQRGYRKYKPSGRPGGTSHTIKIEHILQHNDQFCLEVDCSDGSLPHLLHCQPSLCFHDKCNTNIVIKNDTFTCDSSALSSPKEGQLYLCPPNNFPTNNCTVSTGLVMINTYNAWRGINQNSSDFRLGTHEADTICRQLGFTNAVTNSARTVNSTKDSYSHCYSNSLFAHALLTTQELNCLTTQSCLGCCFHYPAAQDDFCHKCDNSTDIVINCTFDPTLTPAEKDVSKDCFFHDKSLEKSSCTRQEKFNTITWTLIGTTSFFGPLSVALSVALLVICCCYCVRRRAREEEPPAIDNVLERRGDQPAAIGGNGQLGAQGAQGQIPPPPAALADH